MSVKVACSNLDRTADLVSDIKSKIGEIKAKMVVFFASSRYDLEKVGCELEKAYPGVAVFGCSTSGEIVSGQMLKNSLVVQVMDAGTIEDVAVTRLDCLKDSPSIAGAFRELGNHFKLQISEMSPAQYVGIVLFDGLSGMEEKIMDQIGNLTDLVFVGGSAGDDLKFKETRVFAHGKASSNAMVIALIKPTRGFDIIKTQSFKVLKKSLIADEVDEASRTVKKFNGTNAVTAYAAAVGTSTEKLSEKFMSNPLGLMVENEPFVRSPQRIQDGQIVFYCNIKKGMELSLLESAGIVQDTKNALKPFSGAAGVINFNCILRTLELEATNQTEQYGKLFSQLPTIGFSTYGEAYLGHINQTATMLVLK